MPRTARRIVPGFPHHITQRGTDRQTVFHSLNDRRVYLDLLKDNSREGGVRILAYCLMRNHIHLVAVPEEAQSLAVCLRRTHGRYAQYLNARRLRSGHLWQNRFYSCAMDEKHLWNAIRYVEQNPVRSGLIRDACAYRWSSAAAHVGGKDKTHLLDMDFWGQSGGVERWTDLLAGPIGEAEMKRLRQATYSGRPLGTEAFVSRAKVISEAQTWEGSVRKMPVQGDGWLATPVAAVWP